MADQTDSDDSRSRFDSPIVYLLAVLALLLVGGAVAAYLILAQPTPQGDSEELPARLVRVFRPRKTSHRLAITTYGTSRAAEVWTAIAEVKGRTLEVNSRFESGEILPAGTLLVRIDRTDYELARDRYEAEAGAKRLQINELNQSEGHLKEIIELQKRQLGLAEDEYDRQYKLYKAEKVASLSAVEAAENAYVMQLTAVQRSTNSLSLVTVQRLRLEALLKAATVQSEQARRDLDRCEIRLPLDARCASKSVEVNQFVTAGERLGTFLALETAEVVAMVETHKVAALLREAGGNSEVLDLTEISHRESLWKRFRIPVEVTWTLDQQPAVWYGRLARIGSSLDPGTRTVPLIIEIRHPYEGVRPGVRPPLLPGVFCEVTAYGATVDDVWVIPRDALHENRVYLLRDAKPVEASKNRQAQASIGDGHEIGARFAGKLHIQPVKLLALEEDLAVVEQGIEPDDLVILSDIPQAGILGAVPMASQGMPLRGELMENPVAPREKISFPEDLFKDVDVEEAEGPAATEPSADEPPPAAPTPETRP